MSEMITRGRRVRGGATVVVAGLLIAGTLWGDDDEFPFGPFRMYASAPAPDAPAKDTRLEGVDAAGRVVALTERNCGIRRAEVEGQEAQYATDPARLARVAQAYADRSPDAAPLRRVRLVIRWHGVADSRPTGTWTDQVVAAWERP